MKKVADGRPGSPNASVQAFRKTAVPSTIIGTTSSPVSIASAIRVKCRQSATPQYQAVGLTGVKVS